MKMGKRKEETKDFRISFRLTEEEKNSLEEAKRALGASTISEFVRKATYWQILRLETMARLKGNGIPKEKLEEAEIRMRFLEAVGGYLVKYAKERKWEEMKEVEEWMKETIEEETKMLKEVWEKHFSRLREQ